MSTSEILAAFLAVTNTLAGIGWFRTWRDTRAADVSFWRDTIEEQNKVIEKLRSELQDLKQKYNKLKEEVHSFTGFSPEQRRRPARSKNQGHE